MSPPAYVPSYYSATARPFPALPPLQGEVECDVCVVGGGIAGCSAALHLAERGYRVVLLEACRIGWGASGRSGAQVLPGYSCGQEKLVKLAGAEGARALWDMSVEAVALVKSLIQRHEIECDWVGGHLLAAVKERHREELLAERDSLERDYGYRGLRFMDTPEVRDVLATERYVAGLYDANAGHMHVLNYTLGLAAAAQRAGARIFESTRAVSFADGDASDGSPVTVKTMLAPDGRRAQDAGVVRCRHLVLCGNTSLGALAPALSRKIMSVGTYMVATEPLGEARAQALIANNMAVADMNWIIDYFRRSADHRLLFGGRVSYSGRLSAGATPATRARMLGVFPQLADVGIDYAWGGYLDITLNRAPHFGRLSPRVYFFQGFSGHGVALTGLAGKLAAEAIAGTAERFDLFARLRHHDFPGGPLLRRPALVLAMLYYRLRDLL